VFDLSKKQWGSSAEGAMGEEFGEWVSPSTPSPPRGALGRGCAPFPGKFLIFSFQNSAFW